MHLHEYQAKEWLKRYGVPITHQEVISSKEEIPAFLEKWEFYPAVVKVQVHAGGRGKAGGVKLCQNKEELREALEKLHGMKVSTHQTAGGFMVAHQLLVTKGVEIEKEFYFAAVLDRASATMMLIASSEGGMEIEEIAEKSPEKIVKVPIQMDGTVRGYHVIEVCKTLGLSFARGSEAPKLIRAVAKAFAESDASLLEINPLVLTKDEKLIALDAKMTIDANALFRQVDLADCYDPTQELESEVRARKADLAYVAMEGNIGCMVNGAGLAMATMDMIKHSGGEPANFLDVGGSADVEKVTEGFKIILSDPNVRGVLVNIFGGIMNCETIAKGIIQATKEIDLHVPMVIRLEGTNVDVGRQLLKESNLPFAVAKSLSEAAEKISEAIT